MGRKNAYIRDAERRRDFNVATTKTSLRGTSPDDLALHAVDHPTECTRQAVVELLMEYEGVKPEDAKALIEATGRYRRSSSPEDWKRVRKLLSEKFSYSI